MPESFRFQLEVTSDDVIIAVLINQRADHLIRRTSTPLWRSSTGSAVVVISNAWRRGETSPARVVDV